MAGAFVLGALSPAEEDAVRAHLATCSDAHAEIAELGGVLPVLDASVPVVEPPASLRARIMPRPRRRTLEARRHGPASPTPRPPLRRRAAARRRPPTPFPSADRASHRRSGASTGTWVLRIAAVLAIVLLGGWNLLLQNQVNTANAYEQSVAAVLDVAAQPGSHTAILTAAGGSGGSGLAAISASGAVSIAMQDLAATSGSTVYTAWAIGGDGVPIALGDFTVGNNGTGSLSATGAPAAAGVVVALTLEPGPGRDDADPADHLQGRGDRRRLIGRRGPDGPAPGPLPLRLDPGGDRAAPFGRAPGPALRSLPRSGWPHPCHRTGKRATPADTVIGRPATAGSAAIPSRIRCATIVAGRARARRGRTRRHRPDRPCRPAGPTRQAPRRRVAGHRRRPRGRPRRWSPGSRRCRTSRTRPRCPADRPVPARARGSARSSARWRGRSADRCVPSARTTPSARRRSTPAVPDRRPAPPGTPARSASRARRRRGRAGPASRSRSHRPTLRRRRSRRPVAGRRRRRPTRRPSSPRDRT